MINKCIDFHVSKVYISSDIKLSLEVKSSKEEGGGLSFECLYPDSDKIKYVYEVINETLHLKVVKLRSFFLHETGRFDVRLFLPSALSELKVDAANADFHFLDGRIEDYTLNAANGCVQMDQGFMFRKGLVNLAKGSVAVVAPTCFELLSINMATGSASVSLPSTERVECIQKGLLESFTHWHGPQAEPGMGSKKLTLQGALLKSAVLSH